MWIFTPDGYYSVVQKPADRKQNTLTIRTRNREDMDALVANHFPKARPYRVERSDYEWRIRVPKKDWAKAVQRMAMDIDYSNFKDEVTKRQGWKRHGVYARVWSVLLSLEDRGRRWKLTKAEQQRALDFEDDLPELLADAPHRY